MRLVVERPLTVEEESGLIAHVQKSLGHPFRIRLSYFDGKIPVPPTGKFEEFICRAR
jgi:phenylacetate-CoA ligase